MGLVLLTMIALAGCSPSQPSGSSSSTSSISTTATSAAPTTATSTSSPTWPATLPVCGVGFPLPLTGADSPPLSSAEVVTASRVGISLYTRSDDTTRVLVKNGSGHTVFRSTGTVTYAHPWSKPDSAHWNGQDSVLQANVTGGGGTEFLRLPDYLIALGWDPTETRLAYLVGRRTAHGLRPSVLCLYDSQTGSVSQLTEMSGPPLGRGVSLTDEQSVSWSPDGSAIAVVDTFSFGGPGVQVVSVDGTALAPAMHGTFARWLPDGRLLVTLFQQRPRTWYALDIPTGNTDTIALPSAALWPAVSPDGTMIAFTLAQGTTKPVTKVLDLRSGDITRIGSNLAGPMWLSPTEVALTVTTPCQPRTECEPGAHFTNRTSAIEIGSLTRTELKLVSTFADVRLPD